jgi:hypothetical protein
MLKRDAAAKGIVFSQFTSMLDLIGFCLQKSGIKCVKLDGSMSMHARDVMIERFTNDPDCKVYTALPHDMDLTCKFLGVFSFFLAVDSVVRYF